MCVCARVCVCVRVFGGMTGVSYWSRLLKETEIRNRSGWCSVDLLRTRGGDLAG